MTRLGARFRLVGTAVLFSTGGAAIKAVSLTAWQVACLRSAVAALAVFALVPASRRRWTPRVLLVAAIFAATLILFVTATKLTTAANAIFLQSTSPLWVLLAGPLLLRERVTAADVAFMAVVAGGMLLFFVGAERPQTTAPDPARGNVLALVSGACFAGVVLGLRRLGRREPVSGRPGEAADGAGESGVARDEGAVVIVAGNVVCCLATLPLALPAALGAPAHVALADVLALLYLGVVQIGVAYLLMTAAMPHVPALEASTILLVEPALNPLWAWLVQGERPAPLALAGGTVIVLGAAVKSWWDARGTPAPHAAPSRRASD